MPQSVNGVWIAHIIPNITFNIIPKKNIIMQQGKHSPAWLLIIIKYTYLNYFFYKRDFNLYIIFKKYIFIKHKFILFLFVSSGELSSSNNLLNPFLLII